MKSIVAYLKRWQEFLGWAPLAVIVVLVAYVVIGAADRLAVVDALARLVDLAIDLAVAFLASGLAYLIWRRWSYRLTGAQLEELWHRLLDGERGAIVVFTVNAGFYLCITLALLYLFFSR